MLDIKTIDPYPSRVWIIEAGDKIDIIFNLTLNDWNGSRNLEFKIIDLRKI